MTHSAEQQHEYKGFELSPKSLIRSIKLLSQDPDQLLKAFELYQRLPDKAKTISDLTRFYYVFCDAAQKDLVPKDVIDNLVLNHPEVLLEGAYRPDMETWRENKEWRVRLISRLLEKSDLGDEFFHYRSEFNELGEDAKQAAMIRFIGSVVSNRRYNLFTDTTSEDLLELIPITSDKVKENALAGFMAYKDTDLLIFRLEEFLNTYKIPREKLLAAFFSDPTEVALGWYLGVDSLAPLKISEEDLLGWVCMHLTSHDANRTFVNSLVNCPIEKEKVEAAWNKIKPYKDRLSLSFFYARGDTKIKSEAVEMARQLFEDQPEEFTTWPINLVESINPSAQNINNYLELYEFRVSPVTRTIDRARELISDPEQIRQWILENTKETKIHFESYLFHLIVAGRSEQRNDTWAKVAADLRPTLLARLAVRIDNLHNLFELKKAITNEEYEKLLGIIKRNACYKNDYARYSLAPGTDYGSFYADQGLCFSPLEFINNRVDEAMVTSIPGGDLTKIRQTFNKLLVLQKPSVNAEYDPWQQGFEKLVYDLVVLRGETTMSPENLENFYEFFSQFGMGNYPIWFSWFCKFKQPSTKQEALEELSSLLGKKVLKFNSDGKVLAEIRDHKERLVREVTEKDNIEALKEPRNLELIRSMLGFSEFDQALGLEYGVAMMQKLKSQSPEVYKVKDRSACKIEVRRTSRRGLNEEESAERIESQRKALENSDWHEWGLELINLSKLASPGLNYFWLKQQFKEAIKVISESGDETAADSIYLLQNLIPIEGYNQASERLNFIESSKVLLEELLKVRVREPELIETKEKLIKAVSFLIFSVQYSKDRSRDSLTELNQLSQAGDDTKAIANSIINWDYFCTHYLSEYYLRGKSWFETDDRLDEDTLAAISPIWQKLIDKVSDARLRLTMLGLRDRPLKEQIVRINMHPSKGFMLVFGGLVGDACYSSKEAELIAGKYPGLTAWSLTTGETKDYRIRGNFLVVETQTDNGENIWVIRANNPLENFIKEIDPAGFVRAQVTEIYREAVAAGVERIAVSGGKIGGSSSNRSDVTSVYNFLFKDCPKVMLVDTPDTNFNGYPIWDARGKYPSIEVTELAKEWALTLGRKEEN